MEGKREKVKDGKGVRGRAFFSLFFLTRAAVTRRFILLFENGHLELIECIQNVPQLLTLSALCPLT